MTIKRRQPLDQVVFNVYADKLIDSLEAIMLEARDNKDVFINNNIGPSDLALNMSLNVLHYTLERFIDVQDIKSADLVKELLDACLGDLNKSVMRRFKDRQNE